MKLLLLVLVDLLMLVVAKVGWGHRGGGKRIGKRIGLGGTLTLLRLAEQFALAGFLFGDVVG